jgi:pimeloyl-ACP methyl ester carboxylesterase
MSTVLIVIPVLIAVFIAASVVLGRTTYGVGSARDTEYLELEGNWIRYHVTGGGPPVVLVHGWLSSSRVWELLADRLAQRFTVYTLDLSGFGDSDKPISGYGIRYGSRLLYAFCAHFGLTRVAVVGHDIGGTMAVKLAADHPDVVGRLVLVATPADEDHIDLPTLLWLATLPVVGPIFYALGRFLKPLRRLWMHPFVFDSEALTEEVVDDAGKSTPAAAAKTLSAIRREIARGRLIRQADIVKVPVLVVAGEEDQIVDPQAADNWARTVSAELVLIDECGHLPMLERIGEFNARVLAFLTGDPRYLGTTPGPPEEMAREDVTVAEASEDPSSPAREEPETPEPGTPPTVSRKQEGVYPPRSRDLERVEDAHVPSEPRSDPAAEQGDHGAAPDGAEECHRGRAGRAKNGDEASGPVPEMPEGLFEWPEPSEEFRPQDRFRETDRRVREDEDRKDPEEDSRP